MVLKQDLLFKRTHASGYHVAWPGWAVSVSVSPNRNLKNLELGGALTCRAGEEPESPHPAPQKGQVDLSARWEIFSFSLENIMILLYSGSTGTNSENA